MSGEAPLLVRNSPVPPEASLSSGQSIDIPVQLVREMPGHREPCVGQEASNGQSQVTTPVPSSNNTGAAVRGGQTPDGAGSGSGQFGTRPPPQGAPDQAISQPPSAGSTSPGVTSGAHPSSAMAAVVKGSMTAAVVGLIRPPASNGTGQCESVSGQAKADGGKSGPQSPGPSMNRSVSYHGVANGHGDMVAASKADQKENLDEFDGQVELRKRPARGHLRHAHSEAESSDFNSARRRSQTMAEMKEHAYHRLQEELTIAQTDLRLKDEEVEKLSKVRDQMEHELDDLTASLFEEANKMVQEANVKRMHTEKLLSEANQKIEVLQAEVVALKQLVLTSTPSSPNKHLHPQIAEPKEKKVSKPFWKTHRRSTSHHEFTKESRQAVEAQQQQPAIHCKDFDAACYDQFLEWRKSPGMSRTQPFLARMLMEDIIPCLNFNNKRLAERLQHCVQENTLTIEPIPGDSSYPRKCSLTESNKLCNYKIKLGEDSEWYSISQMCRNRIAAVCDFYTYARYIHQGLVRNEDKDVYLEIIRLRRQMALARLGLL